LNDKKIDFSCLGFDRYQSIDLQILMSLQNHKDICEWAKAVGEDDVRYGLGLLEQAALAELDRDTENMKQFPEAMAAIRKVM
jgi:hypothetical protein